MGSLPKHGPYDESRGAEVIKPRLFRQRIPTKNYSWNNIKSIQVTSNLLEVIGQDDNRYTLEVKQYFGYRLNKDNILSEIILEKNKRKLELIDPTHNIGI